MTTEAQKPALEHAVEPVADHAGPQAQVAEAAATTAAEGDGDTPPAREPIASLVDRSNIAKKFAKRRQENDEQLPFNGNGADPTVRTGRLTQELPDDPEPAETEPADRATEATVQAPTKKKLVVRREEREVDDAELTRLAQIGAAGESYLNEAKRLRDEAEALRRASVPRPHPDAELSATAADPNRNDAAQDPSHPMDDRALAERLQFGSPDEAAEVIAALKSGANTEEAVNRAIYNRERQGDVVRAKAAYDDFVGKNAELVNDPIAHAAMEKVFYDGLRDDLRKLGYPDARIPTANEQLVEAHRFHRIQGQPVRDTKDLLEASKDTVLKWRGGAPSPQPQADTARRTIAVNVDRTERRQAIPHQPARTAVPPQAESSAQPVISTRKAAVRQIMQNRGHRIVV